MILILLQGGLGLGGAAAQTMPRHRAPRYNPLAPFQVKVNITTSRHVVGQSFLAALAAPTRSRFNPCHPKSSASSSNISSGWGG